MKRILALFLVLTMVFSMVACDLSAGLGGITSSSKQDGGGATQLVSVFFKTTEPAAIIIGQSTIKVEKGEMLDWTAVPTADLTGCEFVGWAYDINGDRMLDVASDRFDEDTVLYAIFKRASSGDDSDDETASCEGDSDVADSSTVDSNPDGSTTDSSGIDKPTDSDVDESVTDSSVIDRPTSGSTTDSSVIDRPTSGSTTDSSVIDRPTSESTTDSSVIDRPTSESTTDSSDIDRPTSESTTDSSDIDTPTSESTTDSSDIDIPTSESTTDSSVIDTPTDSSTPGSGNDEDVDEDVVYIFYEPGLGMLEDDQWEVELERGDRYTNHPTPTRAGYTFAGWCVDEECTSLVTNGKRYTDDVTYLYAAWEKVETFTVEFCSFGSYIGKTQVVKGEMVMPIEVEYTEGYIFRGWEYNGKLWDFFEDVVTCDMVLEAKYDLQKYSITYENLNGAANSNKTSYTVEDAFTLNDLSLDGYTFEGWYLDEALEKEITTIYYGTTGDIVLYAGWEKIVVVPTPPGEEEAPTVLEKWSGKTLNILATIWGGTYEPSAPWSQPELTVGPNDWNSTAGFGYLINTAILRRAEEIRSTYGVELNWINARSMLVATLLSETIVAGSENTKFHIAMPRILETQDIVATNSIYDLANRRYIDLTKSYYNQASVESYSVHDRTLFAGGDFSFLDESTTFVQYFNYAMLEGMKDCPDLYQLVRDGKWTIEQMTNIAKLVSKNSAEVEWTDDDTYGYGTTNLSRFYQYSGIQQVSTGETEYGIEYVITLNDPKVSTLIDKILTIKNSEWARIDWNGGYGAIQLAFEEGRLLFYDEVVQRTNYFGYQDESFKVGILPEPKLDESQASYCSPCSYQSTVMCVPKATPDREMSDYFFEILAYTGQKYIMKAYMEDLRNCLDAETSAESMEMLEEYVFPGMIYDQGWMYGWDGLLNEVQNESYSSGRPNFTASYEYAIEQARETVAKWNLAWYDYTEKIK